MENKSRNHVFFWRACEYVGADGGIWNAPQTNPIADGYRMGLRFYCTHAAWRTSPAGRAMTQAIRIAEESMVSA